MFVVVVCPLSMSGKETGTVTRGGGQLGEGVFEEVELWLPERRHTT